MATWWHSTCVFECQSEESQLFEDSHTHLLEINSHNSRCWCCKWRCCLKKEEAVVRISTRARSFHCSSSFSVHPSARPRVVWTRWTRIGRRMLSGGWEETRERVNRLFSPPCASHLHHPSSIWPSIDPFEHTPIFILPPSLVFIHLCIPAVIIHPPLTHCMRSFLPSFCIIRRMAGPSIHPPPPLPPLSERQTIWLPISLGRLAQHNHFQDHKEGTWRRAAVHTQQNADCPR